MTICHFSIFFKVILSLTLMLLSLGITASDSSRKIDQHQQIISKIPNASLLLESNSTNKTLDIASDKLLVPASTLKIVTAYLAIQRWGLEHRFHTDFYLDKGVLWIKGYGDPFITSQEVAMMSKKLKQKNITAFNKVMIDNSYFPELRLNGRGKSDNPYDAGNAALAVNFNTVFLKKVKGKFISGEKQTPLTPLAVELGKNIKGAFPKKGKRISLPKGRDQSALYFAQVFTKIYSSKNMPIGIGKVPKNAQLVHRHYSAKVLSDLLAAMLKYSNNFIANQLFLLMPNENDKRDAVTIASAQQYYEKQLSQEFSINEASVVDGAGLSRLNKMSAKQMMKVLKAFKPWLDLLPQKHKGIKAKTGTLSDNHSLAGYVSRESNDWQAFVLMINKKMPYNYRYELAQDILSNR